MRQISEFPRVELGVLPTPLYKLENLSRETGKNIYIKRDDMIGVALGGNKVRKLEFLLADAKEKGVDVVFYRRRCAVQPRHADRSLCFPSGNAGGAGPQKARRACRRQPNPKQDFRGRGLLCGHRFL